MSKLQKTPEQNQVMETPSERFKNLVLREFESAMGSAVMVSAFHKKLIQNYFIKLDQTLKAQEIKRLAKDEKYREPLEYTWKNVNIDKLALECVPFAYIGLDPLQPNHINLIPYKNNNTNKWDITFIIGYVGLEIRAMKYGFNNPDAMIIELVYKNDTFCPIKKDVNNSVENYEFKVNDAFDRGEIVGGFYYKMYESMPQKNKLRVMTKADIDKRMPAYASAEFWGGVKDVWTKNEAGKNVQVKKEVDGWYEEMCYKTIARAAYNSIPIDSEKIDEHIISIMGIINENEDFPKEQDSSPKSINIEASSVFNTTNNEIEEKKELIENISKDPVSIPKNATKDKMPKMEFDED